MTRKTKPKTWTGWMVFNVKDAPMSSLYRTRKHAQIIHADSIALHGLVVRRVRITLAAKGGGK